MLRTRSLASAAACSTTSCHQHANGTEGRALVLETMQRHPATAAELPRCLALRTTGSMQRHTRAIHIDA